MRLASKGIQTTDPEVMVRFVDSWMRDTLPSEDEDAVAAFEHAEDWDDYVAGTATLAELVDRNETKAAQRAAERPKSKKPVAPVLTNEEAAEAADMVQTSWSWKKPEPDDA